MPARVRANYLRRVAQAVLDELDRLALLIARETGRPRSEALLHGAERLGDPIDRVVDLGDDDAKATMLVLDGAPLEATVSGALWAAFAGAGRHPAAVGRLVVAPGPAEALLQALVAGARRLRVGDPRHADTEVGPLASRADLEAVERLVAEAEAGGAERLCGGALALPGLDAAFCAPVVLRGVRADARLIREMPPGPVLAVLEAASEREAIALAGEHVDGAVSVWTADRGHGERVGRALAAELTWVNEHGHAVPSAPVRLARHVSPHQLASQPARLRSARWLPYDPALVRARTAAARLLHGRESERVAALREGALPVAQIALRAARAAAQRPNRSGSNGAGSTTGGSPQ